MSNMLDRNQIEIKIFLSLVENKTKVLDMNRVNFKNPHLCQVFSFKDLSTVFIYKAIEHKSKKVRIESNPKVKDNRSHN